MGFFRIRLMKIGKTSSTTSFFDVKLRRQLRLAKGKPLSRLDAVLDWESFRQLLAVVWDKPATGPGDPSTRDPLYLFNTLLGQQFYGLSDEPTEYPINDHSSSQQFIGWNLADKIPDANTPGWPQTTQKREGKGNFARDHCPSIGLGA
jgi:hypothetical protein